MSKTLYKNIDFSAISPGEAVAVACSGGPDSMALLLLAREWANESGSEVIALTVDHGLRKASAKEAQQVGKWLAKHNIKHHILSWKGKKPRSNLQETARKARYELLTEYCKTHAIANLLVAHARDDQAETFLLRLARGSGVDGLAGMAMANVMNGIVIHRPLLNITKAELKNYLLEKKQKFIHDPSNENRRYDRVKIRQAMPFLETLGLSISRLASTAENMARARQCLEEQTFRCMREVCSIYPQGYALLSPLRLSEEIALRILATLIMIIGGHELRPRLEDLKRLSDALQRPDFTGATLGGCQFIPCGKKLLICRELKAVQAPTSAKATKWDDRFAVTGAVDKQATIAALTQQGWLALAKKYKLANPFPDKRILYTLPTLRDKKGAILAVPHLGVQEKNIKFAAEFTGARRFPDIRLADR